MRWGGVNLPIYADITTDDGQLEATFDAERWFNGATEDQLIELARHDFQCSNIADEVAYGLRRPENDIDRVLTYCEARTAIAAVHDFDPIGFEVRVDRVDATWWLKENRPDVFERVAELFAVVSMDLATEEDEVEESV